MRNLTLFFALALRKTKILFPLGYRLKREYKWRNF